MCAHHDGITRPQGACAITGCVYMGAAPVFARHAGTPLVVPQGSPTHRLLMQGPHRGVPRVGVDVGRQEGLHGGEGSGLARLPMHTSSSRSSWWSLRNAVEAHAAGKHTSIICCCCDMS